MGELVEPDWDAPLDAAAHVEGVPIHATMRGFLTAPVVARARRRGARIGRERYVPFRAYPLREHLEVLVKGAEILHPDLPLRRALREIGRLALPAMRETTVGRVMLSLAAGARGERALELVTKTYQMTRNVGTARVARVEADHAVVELRDVHDFPDSLHVGIFEQLLRDLGREDRVRVRAHSAFDVDLELPLAPSSRASSAGLPA